MVKHLMMGVLLAVGAMALTGCGPDACAKQAECAKKAGTAFSETACRTDEKTSRELAASKSCGAQYDDANACMAGLACDQLKTLEAITANCGGKLNTYAKCIQ